MHSPRLPTVMSLRVMLPRLSKVASTIVGWRVLNASTAFLHPGGIAEFVAGCFGRPAFPSVADLAFGLTCSGPMNDATGHVMAASMQQSSHRRRTAASSVDRGRGSPQTHRSHAWKKLRAS